MRIALLVHDFDRAGGHSRYVSALAAAFSRDHEVHVFANTIGEPPKNGIHIHAVPAWRATALSTILTFPIFAHARMRLPYDIVHAQGFSALRCDVVSAHICQAAWRQARRSIGHLGPKEALTAATLTCIERSLYRRPARVIAVSHKVRAELAFHYGRTDDVCVIHHGVDLKEFSADRCRALRPAIRRQLRLADDAFAGLYIGDLRKGIDSLLDLLHRVADLAVICVTRTPAAEARGRARARGVESRLILCPPTARILEFYAAADLFLFPTIYDAFGMVVSEAMACGLPVITTRAAGVSEMIEPEVEGVILDSPVHGEALAGRVRELMAHPERRAALGTAARAKLETRSWSTVAGETMGVYEEILRRRRRC